MNNASIILRKHATMESLNPNILSMRAFRSMLLLVILILVLPNSIACEMQKFKVFYIPIEAQFIVPPTREDILKIASFEKESFHIGYLFYKLLNQEGIDAKETDYRGFRILIRNPNGKELIISFDKMVFFEDKVYKINHRLLDVVLKELREMEKNNHPE